MGVQAQQVLGGCTGASTWVCMGWACTGVGVRVGKNVCRGVWPGWVCTHWDIQRAIVHQSVWWEQECAHTLGTFAQICACVHTGERCACLCRVHACTVREPICVCLCMHRGVLRCVCVHRGVFVCVPGFLRACRGA